MNNNKEKREIDKIANEVYSWWKKSFVFVKKTKIKTWKSILILVFLAGVSSTLILTVSTDIHITSKAAGETASLSLSPSSINVSTNDNFNLNLLIDTDGVDVVVARAIVNYDTNNFSLESYDISNTVFANNACVSEGKIACEIIDNNTASGTISITLAKPTPGVSTSTGLFATLTFKALQEATDSITIDFIGAGDYTDSDIILDDGNGTDILNSVVNSTITITDQSGSSICESFTYSSWSSCQSNSTQSRTVISSLPDGCINGDPVLSQSCTYNSGGGGGGGGGGRRMPVDTTPPAQPDNFDVAIKNTQATLTWTNPTDSDFFKIKILRKENSTPTSYNDTTAEIIYEGTDTKFIDANLDSNKKYYYSIFAYDTKLNYSNILTISTDNNEQNNNQNQTNTNNLICNGYTLKNLFGTESDMVECISQREAKITNEYNSYVELSDRTYSIYQKIVDTKKEYVNNMSQNNKYSIAMFIHTGTEATKWLGAGERAGVINSFYSAFNRMPETELDWQDTIKIANGRWPKQTSSKAKENAKVQFKKIYLRDADMNNQNDNAAVTVIAYGLRPANRNFDSEKSGINIFKGIFNYNPISAIDWDMVRAISYSGAIR